MLDVASVYIFTDGFKYAESNVKLWKAFIKKNRIDTKLTFVQIVEHIEAFIKSALL